MNNALKKLLTAALAVSTTAFADDTNKTFLMPRSHGVNLAMKYASWSDTLRNKGDDRFGGNAQVTWFYSASTNEGDLGRYFGIRNTNQVHLRYGGWGDLNPDTNANPDVTANRTNNRDTPSKVDNHLDLGYLIHDNSKKAVTGTNSEVMVKLEPEQTSYGFVLDYHQNLEKLLDGLYFNIQIPIVYVKNDMHMRVFKCQDAADGLAEDVLKYFMGEYEGTAGNKQEKLKFAKMGCCSDSTTGVADVELMIGYDFVNDECYHAGINIGLVIPTGNEPEAHNAFEAIVGNGNHFGFGAGLDGAVKLWGEDNHTLKLVGAVNYRYLFESCQKRTLGIAGKCENECTTGKCESCTAVACPKKETCKTSCPKTTTCKSPEMSTELTRDGGGCMPSSCKTDCKTTTDCKTKNECCSRNLGQYHLLGKVGSTELTPAANITTQSVDVTPGSQLDAVLALQYRACSFLVDLGYNLFYKDEESVKFKGCIPENYYVASRAWNTTETFVANKASALTGDVSPVRNHAEVADEKSDTEPVKLTNAQITTKPAETPSQLTHKIFGSLGYRFEDLDTPVTLAVGGGYEFAPREALEKWEIWVKAGINF